MTYRHLVLGILFTLACQQSGAGNTEPPRLILFLVVDQGRQEYMQRFAPYYQGGLKYLRERGVRFTDAHHGHAITETAPGHATLATGRHPRAHGIVANSFRDAAGGKVTYCVADAQHGRSPRNLLVKGLGDWLKAASPQSRVFAASGKDRAAILSGGHGADGAFWYQRDRGSFATSGYYMHSAPAWLREFVAGNNALAMFGQAWEPLAAGLNPPPELEIGDYANNRGFPHALGSAELRPDKTFLRDFYASPFLDEFLQRFARELIANENLGVDEHVDLLALSFSALDTVGHRYGPNSPEVLDTLLRLDKTLGSLFEFLDETIGMKRIVIGFSSDHGVAPLPEVQRYFARQGRRTDAADVLCFQRAGRRLAARFGNLNWLSGDWRVDVNALEAAGLSAEAALDAVADEARACPSVTAVWKAKDLAAANAASNAQEVRYRNNYYPGRSPDLYLQYQPYYLHGRGRGTTHGSPYAYDTHVPMIFVAPGVAAKRITAPVLTVDFAPTLAGLAGLSPPAGLDGVDRRALVLE